VYVEISERAAVGRARLLEFITERHTASIAHKVDEAIEACLDMLPNLPYQWPKVSTRAYGPLHKAVINELTLVFYRIEGGCIQIVDIVDARTDWQ